MSYIYGKHCVHLHALAAYESSFFFLYSYRNGFIVFYMFKRISNLAYADSRQDFDRIFVDFMELFVFGKKVYIAHKFWIDRQNITQFQSSAAFIVIKLYHLMDGFFGSFVFIDIILSNNGAIFKYCL